MANWIYGNDYGNYESNRQAQDREYGQNVFNSLAAQRANRALLAQEDQANASNRMQQLQFQRQVEEDNRRNDMMLRSADLADRSARSVESASNQAHKQRDDQFTKTFDRDKARQIFQDDLLSREFRLKENEFNYKKSPEANYQQHARDIYNGATDGSIPPEILDVLYPGLSPEQKARHRAAWNAGAKNSAEMNAQDQASIDAMNARLLANQREQLIKSGELHVKKSSEIPGVETGGWYKPKGNDWGRAKNSYSDDQVAEYNRAVDAQTRLGEWDNVDGPSTSKVNGKDVVTPGDRAYLSAPDPVLKDRMLSDLSRQNPSRAAQANFNDDSQSFSSVLKTARPRYYQSEADAIRDGVKPDEDIRIWNPDSNRYIPSRAGNSGVISAAVAAIRAGADQAEVIKRALLNGVSEKELREALNKP